MASMLGRYVYTYSIYMGFYICTCGFSLSLYIYIYIHTYTHKYMHIQATSIYIHGAYLYVIHGLHTCGFSGLFSSTSMIHTYIYIYTHHNHTIYLRVRCLQPICQNIRSSEIQSQIQPKHIPKSHVFLGECFVKPNII